MAFLRICHLYKRKIRLIKISLHRRWHAEPCWFYTLKITIFYTSYQPARKAAMEGSISYDPLVSLHILCSTCLTAVSYKTHNTLLFIVNIENHAHSLVRSQVISARRTLPGADSYYSPRETRCPFPPQSEQDTTIYMLLIAGHFEIRAAQVVL